MLREDIISLRLSRHRLAPLLADESEYLDLFRQLQPVGTIHNTYPGAPPSLSPRTAFDDKELTERLRGSRVLVKGRFLGGGIGYVHRRDLQTYANAFRKPLTRLNERQHLVFEALEGCGPLAPRQIKEETGLLNKEIMPALHRMQNSFLVFEDQSDSDMERPWYLFEEEWPDIVLSEDRRIDASMAVFRRFLKSNCFATLEEMRDWSRLPLRFLKTLVSTMEGEGSITNVTVGGWGEGFVLTEDLSHRVVEQEPSVFMLHKADPFVRAHASELKRRFGDKETLQYLLMDGELKGAVLGHWRIGPHDVDDIVVLLPPQACEGRREEVLSVVAAVYSPPRSRILSYCGEML